MFRLLRLLTLLALAACGEDVTLSGTLADGSDADEVWVLGAPARAGVQSDSFRLDGVPAALADLRFARDGEDRARMELRDLPGGTTILEDVWFEDGLAFPSRVRSEGSAPVMVNGLRLGDPESLPDRIDADGIVLASGRAGDALVVRPSDTGLPDLHVVVTPGTIVRSPDGDPVELDGVEFGDSVRVIGITEQGLVAALELVLARELARRGGGR